MKTSDSDRETQILRQLNTEGSVVVSDLADMFGVSAVTIRKDLDALEQRSMLKRVRGGAVRAAATDEGAFAHRLTVMAEAKNALGAVAADTVEDGDIISLDSSTSCYWLAQHLVNHKNLTVVTYGLHVATFLMDESSAMVVMPGGVLRRPSGSLVGSLTDPLEGRGRIGKAFFGVKSLSRQHGLMELALDEAEAKRSLVRAADSIFGLLTSDKVSGFALHSFADADKVTGLFTDAALPAEDATAWDARGVSVTVVSEPDERPVHELGRRA